MLNLLFVLISTVLAGETTRPEIIFENSIEVSQMAKWTLGDFVTLKNHSPKLLDAVENETLDSDIVDHGFNAQVIRQIYKDLVTKFPQITDDNPKLVLPQNIEVKKVAGFSETYFKRKLSNYLGSQCVGCEIILEKIAAAGIPANQPWTVKWEEIKLAPSMLVPVIIDANSPHWVSVNARIKKNVLVSKRFLNFDERISDSDFETKLMDITYSKEDPVTFESFKTYQKTARPVTKGKPIFPSDLKRDPAAERGQTVKVIVGDSTFEVSLSGVAEESGHIGDMIRVKNPDNKKVFSAVVIEKGVVRIL